MEANVLAIFSLCIIVVILLFKREQLTLKKARLNLLDYCQLLLTNSEKSYHSNGFPQLVGQYNGYRVMLDLIPDTITMRKIPPLWLTVTVQGQKQLKGSLDFIVRPQNSGFYSPGWHWDGYFELPYNWPQDAIAKYDKSLASIAVLNQFIPVLFSDIKVKQLLVTPEYVRITYMIKQASRGEYMLLRSALFNDKPINKKIVEAIIKQAISIRKNLENKCI